MGDAPQKIPVTRRRFRPWLVTAGVLAAFAAGSQPLLDAFAGPAVSPREAAWWRLDDEGPRALDSSGHALHGTIAGGAAVIQGKQGGALWLAAPEAAVNGQGRLPSGDSPRSIAAWFRPAQPRADSTAIFDYGSDSRDIAAQHFALTLLPDARLRLGANFVGSFAETTGKWTDESWHFAAAVSEARVSRTTRIYVDGKLDSTGKITVPLATPPNAKWRIGQFLIGGSAFRGAIDDVRVFSHALSDAEAVALYRCSAALQDLPGYYYLPVYSPGLVIGDRLDAASAPIRNDAADYHGIQFARPEAGCALASLRGADVGQDLRLSAELLVPTDAAHRITSAGPYFRSRRAAPGDGLTGATAAGYWVQLLSTGMVKVKRLNPQAVVAFSHPAPGFDPAVFHRLEIEARAEFLSVRLDDAPIVFEQAGKRVERVSIASTLSGAAGIAFASEDNRNLLGGQQARNLQLTRLSR